MFPKFFGDINRTSTTRSMFVLPMLVTAWDKVQFSIEDDEACLKEWGEKVVNVDFNSCFYIARVLGKIFKKTRKANPGPYKKSLILYKFNVCSLSIFHKCKHATMLPRLVFP